MRNENSYGQGLFSIVKGVGLALAFSLLFSVVLAYVLRVGGLSEKVVYPVTQTVKIACAFLGALTTIRGEKGWLKGGAVGLLFSMLSYLAFSAIGGDFSLTWLILFELLVSTFAGVVGGIIGVNVSR